MDLKTRIRVALGIEEETTQLAYEGKLADGTIIVSEADALAEGVAVNVLVEDGTQIPLPVGEYETEEGMKFIVEEEGMIASMETEADEHEDEDDMKKDDELSRDHRYEYGIFARIQKGWNIRQVKYYMDKYDIEYKENDTMNELVEALKCHEDEKYQN